MSDIVVRPLPSDQVRAAYPLVREAAPGLELDGWLRFARVTASPRRAAHSGIMVAQRAGRPFPCGLFCYRTQQDLQHGTVLVADHFVAVDILGPEPVLDAMVAELDRLAQRLGCAAVQSVVRDGSREVASELFRAGHHRESELLAKQLASPRRAVPARPEHCRKRG